MSSISIDVPPRETSLTTKPLTPSLRISHRMWVGSIAAIGVWTCLVAAILGSYIQPSLRIHDEFCYRLAADTLLHGRLANPTPPAWEALQSFHLIMQPAYAAKYPIGPGLMAAIGWLLFGTPHAGSWLSAALLACSTTWMLAGVLPRRWALIGGLLVSLHPFVQLAWSQSLLQGSLTAAGCALLTGSVLRMRRRVVFHSACIGGCGVAVLALSRPFEGLCCTLLCSALLGFAWQRYPWSAQFARAVRAGAFAAAPIIGAFILIIAQNVASTGDWKRMPYQLHEQRYAVAPVFVFSDPIAANIAPRADVPAMFQKFHAVDSYNWYLGRAGWRGWLRGLQDSIGVIFSLSFPFIATLLFSGTRWLKFRVTQGVCCAIALQVAASSCVTWVYAHYLAVLLPWLLLISMVAIRHAMRRSWVSLVIPAILLVQVGCLLVYAGHAKEFEATLWSHRRQEIVDELHAAGGKHLILSDTAMRTTCIKNGCTTKRIQ